MLTKYNGFLFDLKTLIRKEHSMSDFVISGCSVADISHEHFSSRNIEYTCFHYSMDGVEYPDDLGRTISFDDFYAAMVAGADTKTSQVSAGEYISYFEKPAFLALSNNNSLNSLISIIIPLIFHLQ